MYSTKVVVQSFTVTTLLPKTITQQLQLRRILSSSSQPPQQLQSTVAVVINPRQRNRISTKIITTTTTTTTMSKNDVPSSSSSSSVPTPSLPPKYHTLRFCDIGANLLDDRYMKGIYRGTYRHNPDIDMVIQRAIQQNVYHIIVTAGTIQESIHAIQQVRIWNQQYDDDDTKKIRFSCTVGVHPTRCSQVFCHPDLLSSLSSSTNTTTEETTVTSPSLSNEQQQQQEQYANEQIQELYNLCLDGIQDHTVVAYGECGLDYDRIEFCPISIQQQYLQRQLCEVALPLNLPLFLHNRNVNTDLYNVLCTIQNQYNEMKEMSNNNSSNTDTTVSPPSSTTLSPSLTNNNIVDGTNRSLLLLQWDGIYRGVIHSFDDTIELAQLFIKNHRNMYIGINGCSLRTEQNINTIQQLPLERILLETDCPYCDVRSTHIGYQYIQTLFDTTCNSEKKFKMGEMVKSRQEPCHIVQIAEIIAGIKNCSIDVVADTCYSNSLQLFRLQQ